MVYFDVLLYQDTYYVHQSIWLPVLDMNFYVYVSNATYLCNLIGQNGRLVKSYWGM